MTTLRGWSDSDIMECDLVRLEGAVTAMTDVSDKEWRARYRIGGFKVKEPGWDREMDDEEFNQSARDAMAMFKRQAAQ